MVRNGPASHWLNHGMGHAACAKSKLIKLWDMGELARALKSLKCCLLKLCDQGLQIASRHSRVHPQFQWLRIDQFIEE